MSLKTGKFKFFEGERVLCYEPDPTKAKVLYDSKVLDVVINKEVKGKKTVEYLIHFQGWNSSWDRCVEEEFVLKDTPENRQLQRDLAEQSQLQLGAYLYRKERKKLNRKSPLETAEDNNSSAESLVAQTIDSAESAGSVSGSEVESEDDIIDIQIGEMFSNVLEQDHNLINTKNKLMKLPAEPNVVQILENYWKSYCSGLADMSNRSGSGKLQKAKLKPEDLEKNLNLCKEVLDGLRIYFDFTLSDLLLYENERDQVKVACAKNIRITSSNKQDHAKNHSNTLEHAVIINSMLANSSTNAGRKMSLRSNTNCTDATYLQLPVRTRKTRRKNSVASSDGATPDGTVEKTTSWRLLPSYVYKQQPPPASLVYGATHLLRLFVKLPELLGASGITECKLKVVQEHLEMLVNYLSENKDWFGEHLYLDK